jgi:hypothetical protein
VRHWNFAFQKGFAETDGQASGRFGRQDAEQRAPGGYPGERPLQHAHEQTALLKLPDDEGREGVIGVEFSAKQGAPRFDFTDFQNVLESTRWHVQHRDCLTHQWQRRGQALEPFCIRRHCEMTRPSPRGRAQLGQVRRQPLLQLARPARSHQCRPRRATADIDEETRTIQLRAGAGERRGGGARSACLTDGRNQDDPPAHRLAGLAKLLLVTARRSPIAAIGDGGASRTVTSPPRTAISALLSAHGGNDPSAALLAGPPAASASAPASAAPSARVRA